MIELINVLADLVILTFERAPELVIYAGTFITFVETIPSYFSSLIPASSIVRVVIESVRTLNFIVMAIVGLLLSIDGVGWLQSFYVATNWSSILSLQFLYN